MRAVYGVVALGLLFAGCFIDRGGLQLPDAEPVDAGALDADLGGDAQPLPEAARPDGGCTPAGVRCDGEVVVTCTPTGASRQDCVAEDAYCEMGECRPWLCMPLSLACEADLLRCVSRGSGYMVVETCARGCADDACRPERECGDTVDHTMGEGTYQVDLCGAGDDQSPDGSIVTDDCGSGFRGEDVLVRVELRVGGMFRLELDDVDSGRIVDPVLYLRTTCDDELSQIECDDDDGDAAQNSAIVRMLDAGDHFFVLDSLNYDPMGMGNRRTCGTVRFRVTRL